MPEMGTSGLMSGEWKRSEWRDIQTPATERAGHSYGPPSRHRATPRLHKMVAADVRRRISREKRTFLRLLTSAATGRTHFSNTLSGIKRRHSAATKYTSRTDQVALRRNLDFIF